MNISAVFKTKSLFLFFYIFLSGVAAGTTTIRGATMQVAVAGPVYLGSSDVTIPGAMLLMQTGSGNPVKYSYQTLTADSSGHYSTTVTVECKPGDFSGMSVYIRGILENGTISGGHAAGASVTDCHLESPNYLRWFN